MTLRDGGASLKGEGGGGFEGGFKVEGGGFGRGGASEGPQTLHCFRVR